MASQMQEDPRVSAIAELLLLIERELRLQGWWSELPPSEQALASVEPFCVDSMAFEHWLQWLFLPRMKLMLEEGAPLPNASGIQPMAEQVFAGTARLKAQGLIGLLGRFDQMIVGAA